MPTLCVVGWSSNEVKTATDLVPVVIQDMPKRAATARAIALETTAIEIDVNGARIRLNARATAEQISAVVSALRA